MKERPILFSGPMVRAILEGRKTQTRRVVKPQPSQSHKVWHGAIDDQWAFTDHQQGEKGNVLNARCPYGTAGDLLWVRETFWTPGEIPNPPTDTGDYVKTPNGWAAVIYRADGNYEDGAWKPSIFMPRWASRITLCITNVRVEQVQNISAADAIAEGLTPRPDWPEPQWADAEAGWWRDPVSAFRSLWDHINGKRYPWDSNPWVWVIEFERIS